MHSIITLTLLGICLFCAGSTQADIYSSFVHLREAVKIATASNDVHVFKQYIAEQKFRIKQYRQLVTLQKKFVKLVKSDGFLIDNPIAAMLFIGEAHKVMPGLQNVVKFPEPVLDRTGFINRTGHPFIPKIDDLEGSITGIMRLQDIYQLSVEDMANGVVAGFKAKSLTMLECLDIAKHAQFVYKGLNALNSKSFKAGVAVSWLDAAESKVSNRKEAELFIQASREVYTPFKCQCTSDNIDRELYFTAQYPDVNVSSIPDCSAHDPGRCRSFPSKSKKRLGDSNFDALCRGETVLPDPELEHLPTPRHRLRCRYIHRNDPSLLLRPVKMEELNLNHPRIAILHDVIDEQEIINLTITARPHLRRGFVRKMEGFIVSETKVSKQYFVPMNICTEIIPNLRRRLAGVTGLHLRSFEKIQVVNYGTGGFYNLHVDLFTPNVLKTYNETTNNRLVTMVMYLDDVPAGGETAFPLVGIAVKPKKGNALLFYNLKRNGGLVHDSVHSSCPILYGEKWIANQWVGRNGQEFTYRCSKNKFL